MRGETPTHRPPSMKRQPPIPRPANQSAAENASQGGQSISACSAYSAVASEARTGHPHRQNFAQSFPFLYRFPKSSDIRSPDRHFTPIFRNFGLVLRLQKAALQPLPKSAAKKCKNFDYGAAIPLYSALFHSVPQTGVPLDTPTVAQICRSISISRNRFISAVSRIFNPPALRFPAPAGWNPAIQPVGKPATTPRRSGTDKCARSAPPAPIPVKGNFSSISGNIRVEQGKGLW